MDGLITISKDNTSGVIDDIFDICILFRSLYVSMCHVLNIEVNNNPEDAAILHGKSKNKQVRLPGCGVLELSIIEQVKPDLIQLIVQDIEPKQLNTISCKPPFESLMFKFCVGTLNNYFERNLDLLKQSFGDKEDKWPETWRFGWLTRNALSHDGKICIREKNTRPLEWESLKFDYSDNGKILFDEHLNIADIIMLIIEMDNDLNQGSEIYKKVS